MLVYFRTSQLERAFIESNRAVPRWGEPVARTYITRIIELANAQDFADIRKLASLRAHPLKGDRKGQWALAMTGRWRLIVEPSRDGRTVTILEVSQHYGD